MDVTFICLLILNGLSSTIKIQTRVNKINVTKLLRFRHVSVFQTLKGQKSVLYFYEIKCKKIYF